MDNIKRSVTYDYYPLMQDRDGEYQDITPPAPILTDCTALYQKFISGARLSEKQKLELFNNVISNVLFDTNKLIMANQIYSNLLNKGKKYTNAEMIFITQFTVFQSHRLMKSDSESTVYNNFPLPQLRIRYGVSKDAGFSAVHKVPGIIEVNYENFMAQYIAHYFDNKIEPYNLLSYLHIICHEMTHHRQMFEADNQMFTKSAYDYICRVVFYGESFDKDVNYRYRQIEIEAELEGMRQAIVLARNYTPQNQRETEWVVLDSEQVLLETAASIQYAQATGVFYLTDEYDVRGLESVIKRRPEILDQYPQLTVVFDKNTGNIIGEEKLLANYVRSRGAKSRSDLIFEQYLVYKYSNRDVLLNTKLPAELLTQKTRFIISQVRKEYDYCKKVMHLVNSPRLFRVNQEFMRNQAPNIFNMRKQRITLYKEYLEKVRVNENIIQLSERMLSIYYNSIKRVTEDYPDFDIDPNENDLNFDDNINEGGKKL